jgi:hypothetical protein
MAGERRKKPAFTIVSMEAFTVCGGKSRRVRGLERSGAVAEGPQFGGRGQGGCDPGVRTAEPPRHLMRCFVGKSGEIRDR